MAKLTVLASLMLHITAFLLFCFLVPASKPAIRPTKAIFIELAHATTPETAPDISPGPSNTEPEKIPSVSTESATEPAVRDSGSADFGQPRKQTDGNDALGQVSDISRAFADAARIQFMVAKTRQYLEFTETIIKNMLEGSLSVDKRQELEGADACVTAVYGAQDGIDLSVEAGNDDLRHILLNNVDWKRIPSPRKHMLRYKKVVFHIFFEKSRAIVGISPQ